MNEQDLARLENEAAEIVGAMKELFKEFEKRIGEVISIQRVSASEARAEGSQAAQHLQELAHLSQTLVEQQRTLLSRIEQDWRFHIDSNAQRAGEAQAKAFGESIAKGLQGRLADLAAQVDIATRQLSWKISVRWILSIVIAIPLTVAVCVTAFLPHVDTLNVERAAPRQLSLKTPRGAVNLTEAQVREAVSKLSLCQVAKTSDWHPCIEVDSPPRMGLGAADRPRVAVRGM